jgi:DNA-binding Lrp family transcriptional regulator
MARIILLDEFPEQRFGGFLLDGIHDGRGRFVDSLPVRDETGRRRGALRGLLLPARFADVGAPQVRRYVQQQRVIRLPVGEGLLTRFAGVGSGLNVPFVHEKRDITCERIIRWAAAKFNLNCCRAKTPIRFLLDEPRPQPLVFVRLAEAVMDELLKLLQTNALESRENLGKLLNVPVAEVNQRIAEYEKRGVIRGYQAVLNEDQLNLDKVTAVIEVKVTPSREGGFNNIAERISRFPEVRSAYLMSGTYDLLLFVEGDNLRQVATFVSERLSPLDGVLSTSTHFMLKTYKRLGVLMHQDSTDERLSVSP